MVDAFAPPVDLADRLGRVFTTKELTQVSLLLGDASTHLRSVIGWQVYPPVEVTVKSRQYGYEWLSLPGHPVIGVTSVTVDGVAVTDHELFDGALLRPAGWAGTVQVTYRVGYAAPPAQLATWSCVLASQALSMIEEVGTLGSGGVSSVAVDDYRKAWANGGEDNGYSLPRRVEEALRHEFATGAHVTGTRT